jgi:uncharacterized protein
MRALLDVNVLIALLDSDHVHHATAHAWLENNIGTGWASCPLTQNGCIRIMSQPAYPGCLPARAVAQRLRAATATPWHAFWPDSISLVDESLVDWSGVLGSRQVTDVYLLGLAVRNAGRFATFDRSVPRHAVAGAGARHLALI